MGVHALRRPDPFDALGAVHDQSGSGQVGDAVAYFTAAGTACWMFYAFAGTGDDPNDNYHYAKVIVPQALDVTTSTPTVFVVHGATATEECITKGAAMIRVTQSWLDLGWPVVATREGSSINPTTLNGTAISATWGNQRARAGMVDAWRWAQQAWTPHPLGFLVFGISMGGAGGLNFAAEAQRQHIPVGALYSVDGVTNLAASYNSTSSFRKPIRTAYGLPTAGVPGTAQWIAKVDTADGGHDPQNFGPKLWAFPIRLCASPGDPTVLKAYNTDMFYMAAIRAGWASEISILSYTGGHCSASHFRPADVNPFFVRATQRTNRLPIAAFEHALSGAAVSFDASASTDRDGFITAYDWDFGDGATGTGVTITHDFEAGMTYSVTLTVSDNRSGTAQASVVIDIPPPDDPPPEA